MYRELFVTFLLGLFWRTLLGVITYEQVLWAADPPELDCRTDFAEYQHLETLMVSTNHGLRPWKSQRDVGVGVVGGGGGVEGGESVCVV